MMFFIIVGAIVTFIFVYSISEMILNKQIEMEKLKRANYVCQMCENKVYHVKLGDPIKRKDWEENSK